MVEIRAQEGAQSDFINTSADIAIYGGAAGGGKSYAILIEVLRHITTVKGFGAVIFRRTSPQIRNEGGLWDTSSNIYPLLGAQPKESVLEWHFDNSNKVKFAHLEHEKNKLDYQGSQIPLIIFDELTHFTESQFWYMLSRNRSVCGIKPYIRATTNPEDGWVLDLIDWWIGKDGYAIPERSGVVRYFVRNNGVLHWADSRDPLIEQFGSDCEPKSFTFINATIQDNEILLKNDPSYIANLKALPEVERKRLLEGNWKVKPEGQMFKAEWWQYYDVLPELEYRKIYADTAQKTGQSNDYSVFQCWGKGKNGKIYLIDQIRGKWEAPQLHTQAVAFWQKHYGANPAKLRGMAIEDKVSGTGLIQAIKHQARFPVESIKRSTDKQLRANDVLGWIESEYVYLPKNATWLSEYLAEFSQFPQGRHDDQVDPTMDAIADMSAPPKGLKEMPKFTFDTSHDTGRSHRRGAFAVY